LVEDRIVRVDTVAEVLASAVVMRLWWEAAPGVTADIPEVHVRIPEENLHSAQAAAEQAERGTVAAKGCIRHRAVEAAVAALE
jgi:hypothetical protein